MSDSYNVDSMPKADVALYCTVRACVSRVPKQMLENIQANIIAVADAGYRSATLVELINSPGTLGGRIFSISRGLEQDLVIILESRGYQAAPKFKDVSSEDWNSPADGSTEITWNNPTNHQPE